MRNRLQRRCGRRSVAGFWGVQQGRLLLGGGYGGKSCIVSAQSISAIPLACICLPLHDASSHFPYSLRRSLIPTVGWDPLNLEAQFAHVTSLAASSWMKVVPFVSRRPFWVHHVSRQPVTSTAQKLEARFARVTLLAGWSWP